MGVVYPFLEKDEESNMRKAAEKLKSSRGASLMMALLLFLTCAVVGSAVLTAGTAASGRMAKIAESDQRYYSVNSAANLLIDLLQEPVSIRKTETTDPDSGTKQTVYFIKSADGTEQQYSSETTEFSSLSTEIAYLIVSLPEETTEATSLQMELKNVPGAPVEISGKLYPDNRLEFTVNSVSDEEDGEDEDRIYTVHLAFSVENPGDRSEIKWKLIDFNKKSEA